MPTCPNCDRYLTYIQAADGTCPACQRETDADGASDELDWRNAAKVANLAEAGYLVSCLAGEGIEARLLESSSFSAANGAWTCTYLLQVPAEALAPAQQILHAEAVEASGEESDYDAFGEPAEDEPVHLVFWRPVALMAVAGLATLWLSHRMPDPRPRGVPQREAEALGAAVEEIGRPFVVQNDTGHTIHRLRYRPANHTWYLESDTNGDGRLDRRQAFAIEELSQ